MDIRLDATPDAEASGVISSKSIVPAAIDNAMINNQMDHPALLQFLTDQLDSDRELERFAAVKVLGRMDTEKSASILISALEDGDEDVRIEAARALSQCQAPNTAAALCTTIVEDPCADAKLAAIKSLSTISTPGGRETTDLLRRMVVDRDENIVWDDEEFHAGGWDDWLDLQIAAIEALGMLGVSEAADDIVTAMNDEMGQDLSAVGCKTLAQIGEAGMTHLTGMMSSENARLRRAVAQALTNAPGPVPKALIDKLLHDEDETIRLVALRHIASSDASDRRLNALWRDPSSAVRAEMFRTCPSDDEDRFTALLRERSNDVQVAILDVVARDSGTLKQSNRLLGMLRSKLRSDSEDVACAAAKALAARGPVEIALQDLCPRLADAEASETLACAIAESLGNVRAPAAVDALAQTASTPSHALRRVSLMTLARLAGDGDEHDATSGVSAFATTSLIAAAAKPAVDDAATETDITGDEAEAAEMLDEALPPELAPDGSTLGAILQAESDAADAADRSRQSLEEEQASADEDDEGLPSEFTRKAAKHRRVVRDEDISVPQDVRMLVTRLLGDIDGPDVHDALTRTLESEDEALAAVAASALTSHLDRGQPLADGSLERLVEAMSASEQSLRTAAIRAVKADGASSACDTLMNLLSHEDPATRREAAEALYEIDGAGDWVDGIVSDPDANVRLSVLQKLADNRDPRGCTGLVGVVTDFPRSHHLHAAKALRCLDREGVVDALLSEAKNTDNPALRPFILEAIEQIYI